MGKPKVPTVPAARQMDNYSTEVAQAFADAEKKFFTSGTAFKKDNKIDLISKYGYFKIDTYENTSPQDLHYVVFFYNKATQEVYETHGTLAFEYINLYRNKTITNFLLLNDQKVKGNNNQVISIQSEGVLTWDSGTNRVTQQLYSKHIPARDDQLIAFSESYTISNSSTTLINWKKSTLQKVGFRGPGAPYQILLHETAGMNMSESAVFKVPAHFCIGNRANNKGIIYQMADIACSVPHGEHTNGRAIGIEFVNAPFDIWKLIPDPKNPKNTIEETPRTRSHFKLNESTAGIYLFVEKINIRDATIQKGVQFIPLEFSEREEQNYFEIFIEESKLINKDSLLAFKINNKNIATRVGTRISIKYCYPLKFETLNVLVENFASNKLIKQCNLQDKNTWQSIYVNPKDKKTYYFYDKIFNETITNTPKGTNQTEKTVIMHFPVDLTLPAIFSHGHIGHHSDGFLQGIYLYLRIFEHLPAKGTLQSIIYLLTSPKTAGESNPIEITEILTVTRTSTIDNNSKAESNINVKFDKPVTPLQVKPKVYIELDKLVIERECPGVKTSL